MNAYPSVAHSGRRGYQMWYNAVLNCAAYSNGSTGLSSRGPCRRAGAIQTPLSITILFGKPRMKYTKRRLNDSCTTHGQASLVLARMRRRRRGAAAARSRAPPPRRCTSRRPAARRSGSRAACCTPSRRTASLAVGREAIFLQAALLYTMVVWRIPNTFHKAQRPAHQKKWECRHGLTARGQASSG